MTTVVEEPHEYGRRARLRAFARFLLGPHPAPAVQPRDRRSNFERGAESGASADERARSRTRLHIADAKRSAATKPSRNPAAIVRRVYFSDVADVR